MTPLVLHIHIYPSYSPFINQLTLLPCNREYQPLGDRDVDTLVSMNSLAGFYHKQTKYILAEKLYAELMVRTRETLGETFPSIPLRPFLFLLFVE